MKNNGVMEYWSSGGMGLEKTKARLVTLPKQFR
jgi:hypothetical protein